MVIGMTWRVTKRVLMFPYSLPPPSESVAVLSVLLCPLAVYHRLWQRVCVRLEPALQWLDFSASGYMMSKPFDNQCE